MWKLIFNTTTSRGVACNRDAQEGEFLQELPPSECAWFMSDPERYQWNGTGIEEVPGYLDEQALTGAKNAKQAELLNLRKYHNNEKPFEVNGVSYVNDEANIQGVKVQILDKDRALPLPTFIGTPMQGSWKAADNSYIPFTNGEFIDNLCETYFTMRSHNFTNHGILSTQLDTLTTIEDVELFDITTGWM